MCFLLGIDGSKLFSYLDICALFLPIVIILITFSGRYRESTQEYGILLLIRSYGKEKHMLKVLLDILLECMCLFILEIGVYWLNGISIFNMKISWIILEAIFYIIGVFELVLFQFFLEMLFPEKIANILAIVGGMSALLLWQYELGKSQMIILSPIVMFSRWNGIDVMNEQILYTFLYQILLIFVCIMILLKLIQRKDIL